ncbi:MAG TPA: carbohydrate ABC transporter permease, partial [Caldilineaceae bacterium]|nr:carbohydrate ABC transporter permease [Caldilineaceae bacterium]
PFGWMLATTLKEGPQVCTWPPVWSPSPGRLDNYTKAWSMLPFAQFYWNTIRITFLSIIGTVISCSLAAYGFARLRFRGRDLLFVILLATLMLPSQVTLIPQYIWFARLGWVNTYLPLIVPAFLGNPFSIFLLRQFFMSIPHELDDAAKIDGCSFFGIYSRIIMPLSKAAVGVVAIFSFTYNWNDFLNPLIYLQSIEQFTISLGLRMFQTNTYVDMQSLMAMSVVALIPQLVIFFLAQRHFVQGVVLTGIKG